MLSGNHEYYNDALPDAAPPTGAGTAAAAAAPAIVSKEEVDVALAALCGGLPNVYVG